MIPRQRHLNIIGVQVSAINMQSALATLDAWIDNGAREYVCVANVHTLMESYQDADFRHINNQAGMVTPDGMPLVWVSRWRGFSEVSRVYGPDLLLAMCEHSQERGYKHFFYGGAEGVAETLVERLKARYPALNVVGHYSPPFRALSAEEIAADIAMLNASKADMIWVGLGAPKQEQWMATHRPALTAPALIGVGAAFDFHAGVKPQAPLWMQRNGLEWLFRLVSEPRRLWRRYLINNPWFVLLVLAQQTGLKRFDDA